MRMWLRRACAALLVATAGLGTAQAVDESDLLPVDEAFALGARAAGPDRIALQWRIADGYYLYRHRISVVADPAFGAQALQLPHGDKHHDEFFGDVETYRGVLVVKVPVVDGAAGQAIVVMADSQGCADAGICYPPNTQQVKLALPAPGTGPGPSVEATPPRKGWFH